MNDKLEADIRRGQLAKQLLDNELFVEAWEKLRTSYFDAWCRSSPTQDAEREKLHVAVGILNAVRRNFEEFLNTGKLAAEQLEYLIEQKNAGQLQETTNRGF